MDQLTLTATVPGGLTLDRPLIVSDSLQRIAIRPLLIVLDVGGVRNLTATGVYTVSTGEIVGTIREENLTDNVDWVVISGTNNLSVSNVRGTKGLVTGLVAGAAEITAACGLLSDRKPVDINASDTSTATILAFRIGNQLVTGNQIAISRSANLAPLILRASTGSEYDADNDITSTVDFQVQSPTSMLTPPFVIDGNRTSTPTIRILSTGTATIVATETTEGIAPEMITITVNN
jgi:hypothetical protein